jgi:hypothetical protein
LYNLLEAQTVRLAKHATETIQPPRETPKVVQKAANISRRLAVMDSHRVATGNYKDEEAVSTYAFMRKFILD